MCHYALQATQKCENYSHANIPCLQYMTDILSTVTLSNNQTNKQNLTDSECSMPSTKFVFLTNPSIKICRLKALTSMCCTVLFYVHQPYINLFLYTGQENPTGSVVLDFSVWYCLSSTHFQCVSFKLICRAGVREK